MQPEAAYDFWEEAKVPDIPERSRFYSLAPIGVGTPQIESLSGYVARLAEAHALSVGDMVGREPMSTARTGLSRRTAFFRVRRPSGHVFHAEAYEINGMSVRVLRWVSILERLTCRQHLDALTLLPLRNTLSTMLLFKRRRAWCPECYESDQKVGAVYERLLWTLRDVTACPIHTVPLEEKCPLCHEALPPLAVHSRPGHCSSCGGWLGRQRDASEQRATSPEADYELYVAIAAGDLLACCSTAGRLSRARFRTNLRICIERLVSENMNAFADFTRASKSAVRSWVAAAMRPRLDVLLRVCFHLGISAAALLTSRRLAGLDWHAITTQFPRHDRGVKAQRTSEEVRRLLVAALRDVDCPSIPELARRLGYKRDESLRQVDRALCRRITAKHRASRRTHWWRRPGAKRICEIDAIRSALEQSLAQDPPVSARRIAAKLGYSNAGLIQRKFPDHCRAIAQKLEEWKKRRLEELRQVADAASHEEPPPTLYDLSRRLGFKTSSQLRYHFPDAVDRLVMARAIHAQKETATLRTTLLFILCGESAPSLSSVARQIDLSVSSLSEKCPDLCAAIRSRYLWHQRETTRKRRELLNEEVRRIARDLHGRGQNPTQARIMRLLSEGSLKEWGAFQRAVKRARRYLGMH
jgi:hypothetical protein